MPRKVYITPENDIFADCELSEKTKAWNDYLSKVNADIISMDGFKEKQRQYIEMVRDDMTKNPDFDIQSIMSWYSSQMQICGLVPQSINGMYYNNLYPNVFSYLCTNIDLDKICADLEASKKLLSDSSI